MRFPGFLFGDEQSVVDAAEAQGLAWADAFRQTRTLELASPREVSPGEIVIVHDGTLDPFTPRWRLFGASFALVAAELALAAADRAAFTEAARAHPWAALAACIRHRPPNTVAALTARARAVLDAWSALATLRYAGAARRMPSVIQFPEPESPCIGLDALVAQLFAGPLAVWGPQVGATRLRLVHALDAMASATLDEARARLGARMVALARDNRRTKGTCAEDPACIEAALVALSPSELAALVPAVTQDLLPLLYALVADDAPISRAT